MCRYELLSVLVMYFERSNRCYGLSAKLCIYTFIFRFFLTGLICCSSLNGQVLLEERVGIIVVVCMAVLEPLW